MRPRRKLSRRSFFSTVAGGVVAAGGAAGLIADEAHALQVTDRDPTDPVGRGRGGSGITDRDPSDPVGRGRGGSGAAPHTGITDRDPGDPVGSGRGGSAAGSGCSDSDPTDPGGNGRNCGTRQGGGSETPYVTGRRERRYEVCWVDHPNRSNEECNLQIYSEWAITYSDGRVEYDTAESMRRRAEMEASGYTARWHRMLVNDW